MSIEDFIREQAEKQLDKATKAISDGDWVDSLTTNLRNTVDTSDMDPTIKSGAKGAISAIENNKEKITGMGAEAFTLMVHQIASGRNKDAANTYLQALGSADLLIEAMDRGTAGLIEAKKQIDQWWDDAWELVKEIAIKGAQYLLPLLIAL